MWAVRRFRGVSRKDAKGAKTQGIRCRIDEMR